MLDIIAGIQMEESMTKISIASDLHLEFDKKQLYIPKFNGEDILILAGDIIVGLEDKWQYWFADLLETRSVIWIAGNHEFYNNDLYDIYNGMPLWAVRVNEIAERKDYKYKLYALQNQTLEIDNVKFIAATLWTDFKKNDDIVKWIGERNMSDYKVIRNGNYRLTTDTVYSEHQASVKFIEQELDKPTNLKKFVITHHLPSYQSVAAQYRNPRDEQFNYLYCSDLDNLAQKADYWIHGHTHNSFDYQLGNCRVICNPRGYAGYDTNKQFTDVVIDV